MEIKTFRAKTMPQALALVRSELGPEAMVLHTRELNAGLLGRMFLGRQYEIAATGENRAARLEPANAHVSIQELPVPSPRRGGLGRGEAPLNRLPGAAEVELEWCSATLNRLADDPELADSPPASARGYQVLVEHVPARNPQSAIRNPPSVDANLAEFSSLVEQLRNRRTSPQRDMPPALFDAFTDMIEADIDEELARELVDRLRREAHLDVADPLAVRARLAHLLEGELGASGAIPVASGAGRVVALVGPTGVGKTTTIAKLAANFRLRENRRVGLITVDTYRIAAVEQLRTYADIIDLPMEVVSTPREMREAVQRMRSFDLVLMDTAGRSPRDEVRIRELRSMLAEAAPAEIHLVLSAASSARSLAAAAEKFGPVGVTSVLVTKLDEATGLGNLLSLSRACGLPFSYLTDGQNVPDDISVANAKRLSQLVLNINA